MQVKPSSAVAAAAAAVFFLVLLASTTDVAVVVSAFCSNSRGVRSAASSAFAAAAAARRRRPLPPPPTGLSMATSSEDEGESPEALALREYMIKSQEEKLRAVKAAEDRARDEIEALNAKIANLEEASSQGSGGIVLSGGANQPPASSAPPPPPLSYPSESKEEMAAKLLAYQRFMSEYIVKAQEQKLKAVKEAEMAAERKFQERLLLLGAAPSPPPTAAAAAAAISVASALPPQNRLFAERNARVGAAAKAGRSRWGDMENARAASVGAVQQQAATPAAVMPAAAAPPAEAEVPPEVEAADHGMRADGGVGGPTLAQRVALGASAAAAPPSSAAAAASASPSPSAPAPSSGAASLAILFPPLMSSARESELYAKRNVMVSASAEAGMSRWGDMEVRRAAEHAERALAASSVAAAAAVPVPAAEVAAANVPVPPEVAAADHGLRADGGVGGLTLAERVALGASANDGASASTAAAATPSSAASVPALSVDRSLYQRRNVMVTASAGAGKSRWGDMEIAKAAEIAERAASLPPAAPSSSPPPSSGSTPTLAERVNLGAQLLQNA